MGYASGNPLRALPRLPRPPRSASVVVDDDPRLLECPICRTGDETGPLFDDGARWPSHVTCVDWAALPPPNPARKVGR